MNGQAPSGEPIAAGFGRRDVPWVALAALVALLSTLPLATWLDHLDRSHEVGREYLASLYVWLIGLAVLVLMALVVARLWNDRVGNLLERARRWAADLRPVSFQAVAALAALIVAAALSGTLFQHVPHHVDTVAQLFQARIFAAASLTAPAPGAIEFFGATNLVRDSGAWFSQYPPGHPALLALGWLVGLSWLVNPIFAAGTVALLFVIARRLHGEGVAKIATILYLISPFALFMSASYMNHVSVVFFLTLALYTAVRAIQGGAAGWPIALGLALAAAASIRPLEAAVWALVLGVWVWARRGFAVAGTAALTTALGIVPLLAYNWLTTASPMRFGYTLLWGPGHGLGFHTDPWGEPFTPVSALVKSALDFRHLNETLFAWPFPSLIFLLIAVAWAGRRRGLEPLIALFLAAPFAYFFYWHRDSYLGPRFLFASIVPCVLLSAVGIALSDSAMGERWRPAFRLALLAGVVFALVQNVPARAGMLAGQYPEMELDPHSTIDTLGVDRALVLVKVGWGSRLIGRMWGWGVPAPDVETTFRGVDGCRLQLALDEADRRAQAGSDSSAVRSWLRETFAEWRSAALPVSADMLPDLSVRVDTTRTLAEPCLAQVALDRSGFTVYESLIWRNDPWLRDGVVYARSLGFQRDLSLRRSYPGRPHFLYAPASPRPHSPPRLFPLTALEKAAVRTPDPPPGGDR